MQHGMHNTLDLMKVESQLLDRELKYHYLVADERMRRPQASFIARLVDSLRVHPAPRPMLAQQRGV